MWRCMGESTASERNSSRRLLFFMDCTGHEIIISSGPHPMPHLLAIAVSNVQTRLWTVALAPGDGALQGLDFPRLPNSLSRRSRLCNTQYVRNIGSAWARRRQESVTHVEGFYFFMDCTGHEIIISSGPHPMPHLLAIAVSNVQTRI